MAFSGGAACLVRAAASQKPVSVVACVPVLYARGAGAAHIVVSPLFELANHFLQGVIYFPVVDMS